MEPNYLPAYTPKKWSISLKSPNLRNKYQNIRAQHYGLCLKLALS